MIKSGQASCIIKPQYRGSSSLDYDAPRICSALSRCYGLDTANVSRPRTLGHNCRVEKVQAFATLFCGRVAGDDESRSCCSGSNATPVENGIATLQGVRRS